MSAHPEALRIADECEQSGIEWRAEVHTRLQAAAELRRLHAEVEAQRILLQKSVEAWDSNEIDTDPVASVIEAIRNHLTQKGATQ